MIGDTRRPRHRNARRSAAAAARLCRAVRPLRVKPWPSAFGCAGTDHGDGVDAAGDRTSVWPGDAAEATSMRAYMVLALPTGARTEELRPLTWQHVDLRGRPPKSSGHCRPRSRSGIRSVPERTKTYLWCRVSAQPADVQTPPRRRRSSSVQPRQAGPCLQALCGRGNVIAACRTARSRPRRWCTAGLMLGVS
jgi:integrase